MRTYQQNLCADTGCSLGDFPEVMDDRDEWWELRKSLLAPQHNDDDDNDESKWSLDVITSFYKFLTS